MNDSALVQSWFDQLNTIGVQADGSTLRLGYTETEDQMIDCIVGFAREFGMQSYQDSVGNTFIYNGNNQGDYTVIGSHVDSVVNGGKFDGVAGVISGLLVLKWIADAKLDIPVKVGIFRMEESSVMGMATVGSKLISGKINEAKLKQLKNDKGITLYDILKQKGYKTQPEPISQMKEYLELHIEQGRVLESENLPLGVVNCIAAPTRKWVTITGRQDHSGATPMGLRKDALTAAAQIIVEIEKAGQNEANNSSVATVGVIKNTPNAFNVIPGEVTLGIDIRGIKKDSIAKVVTQVEKAIRQICEQRGLSYDITDISASDPVDLDPQVEKGLAQAAEELSVPFKIMPSGAGHDAMNFTDFCKVGMLFIPCKEGISHNKEELAKMEDIVTGSKVLLQYLKNHV